MSLNIESISIIVLKLSSINRYSSFWVEHLGVVDFHFILDFLSGYKPFYLCAFHTHHFVRMKNGLEKNEKEFEKKFAVAVIHVVAVPVNGIAIWPTYKQTIK